MKKLIIFALALIATVNVFAAVEPSDKLINALIKVESNGKPLVIGDNGSAYGCLQIHKATVEDVNRVYKTNYTHRDAFNPTFAKDICKKYLTHYGKVYQRKTGKAPTDEVFARIWNGGPTGWNTKHTKRYANTTKYWYKVKKHIA